MSNRRRLVPVHLPKHWDDTPIDAELDSLLVDCERQIQAFEDRYDVSRIEQYVASDFRLVYRGLRAIIESVPRIGNSFLEWGCGFAVITCLADRLGCDSTGVEANLDLIKQAKTMWPRLDQEQRLWAGNFLPEGAEELAEDPTLPSLGHSIPVVYDQLGLELSDFAIVFSYPWPGENQFHESVICEYGTLGQLHVQFAGPNDLRVFQVIHD